MNFMDNFVIFDLSESQKWNEYLQRLPLEQQDIYYTPEYYSLSEEIGDGRAQCFVYEKDNEIALYPFLINSVNELGFDLDKQYFDIQGAYGYNGVVTSNCSFQFKTSFNKAFKRFCKVSDIIAEFTRFHPLLQNVDFHKGLITVLKDRNTVALDLTQTYDSIWTNSYTSKNRNMIRKAQKSLFTVNIYEKPNLEQKLTFIKIYHETMKSVNAGKYYFFNEKYFMNMFSKLNSNAVIINAVNIKNEIECTAIIFIYGIFAHYHLSGRKARSDNSVNNFVLDEAVKYAINKGIKKFHFGGGITTSDNDNVFKFKSNFSKVSCNFFIGKYVYDQKVYYKVVEQWGNKYPEKIEQFKNRLLKYRY
jgi:hypothetical protein